MAGIITIEPPKPTSPPTTPVTSPIASMIAMSAGVSTITGTGYSKRRA
jgi:hypothetical protein